MRRTVAVQRVENAEDVLCALFDKKIVLMMLRVLLEQEVKSDGEFIGGGYVIPYLAALGAATVELEPDKPSMVRARVYIPELQKLIEQLERE